jgi:hypothetical protein
MFVCARVNGKIIFYGLHWTLLRERSEVRFGAEKTKYCAETYGNASSMMSAFVKCVNVEC